jgi:hypothetical protein
MSSKKKDSSKEEINSKGDLKHNLLDKEIIPLDWDKIESDSAKEFAIGINQNDNIASMNINNQKQPSQILAPYTIHIKNLTDEKLYDVDLFNYEHEKQKKIKYSCTHGVSYEYFLRLLASYNKPSESIRMMRFYAFCDYHKFQQKQLRSCIRSITTTLDGRSASIPNNIAIYMNAYQQQGNIIEVPLTDKQQIKLSNELQLRLDYLMPESEMTINLFPVKID